MSKSGRFTALVIAAVVVISLATYLSVLRNRPREAVNAPLLPMLPAELNKIDGLTIRKGATTPAVTLHKQAEQWTVAERGDYPADLSKLRTLLTSLTDAKVVEEKTSNPANFAILGVADPAPDGAGVEVLITAGTSKNGLIIGKPAGEGTFVRRTGENRSFIVRPAISVDTEAHAWIEPHLLDVSVTTIQNVQIKPAADTGYSLQRQPAPTTPPPAETAGAAQSAAAPSAAAPGAAAPGAPTGDSFTLVGVPPGRKPADAVMLSPPPSMLSGLRAEDVAAASAVDFGKASTATITLTDGTTLNITGTVIADKHWIQIASNKDATTPAKTAGRAFEIAGYRYEGIFRPLEQLLLPKDVPVKKPSSKAKAPAPP